MSTHGNLIAFVTTALIALPLATRERPMLLLDWRYINHMVFFPEGQSAPCGQ
jgi:hypothetical protein